MTDAMKEHGAEVISGTDQSEAPASAVDAAGEADDGARLLAFLHERDAMCPLCGYNLRNLTIPRCPECRQDLELTVGVRKVRFGWFLAAIAPGLFSGIAALLLLVPIVIVLFTEGPLGPWFAWAVEAFGLLSGVAALLLIRHRYVFIRQSTAAQRWWALGTWTVHLTAFLLLMNFVIGW